MIFLSVGSMLPFERLVETVDRWAGARPGRDDVFMQIGWGRHEPQHARWTRMLSPAEFRATLQQSRLFVAHLGMGSLMAGMEAGVPMVLMPRLKRFGEINTDHQLSCARWLDVRPGVRVALNEERLVELLDLICDSGMLERPEGISSHASPALIAGVRSFIDRWGTTPGSSSLPDSRQLPRRPS